MKKTKNKVIATIVSMLFILSMTSSMFLIQTTNAHSPPWTNIPTYCYVAAVPETIGVGQQPQEAMVTDGLSTLTLPRQAELTKH